MSTQTSTSLTPIELAIVGWLQLISWLLWWQLLYLWPKNPLCAPTSCWMYGVETLSLVYVYFKNSIQNLIQGLGSVFGLSARNQSLSLFVVLNYKMYYYRSALNCEYSFVYCQVNAWREFWGIHFIPFTWKIAMPICMLIMCIHQNSKIATWILKYS